MMPDKSGPTPLHHAIDELLRRRAEQTGALRMVFDAIIPMFEGYADELTRAKDMADVQRVAMDLRKNASDYRSAVQVNLDNE